MQMTCLHFSPNAVFHEMLASGTAAKYAENGECDSGHLLLLHDVDAKERLYPGLFIANL